LQKCEGFFVFYQIAAWSFYWWVFLNSQAFLNLSTFLSFSDF